MKTDRELLIEAFGIINTLLLNSIPGKNHRSDLQLDYRAYEIADKFVHDHVELAIEAEFPNVEGRAKVLQMIGKEKK